MRGSVTAQQREASAGSTAPLSGSEWMIEAARTPGDLAVLRWGGNLERFDGDNEQAPLPDPGKPAQLVDPLRVDEGDPVDDPIAGKEESIAPWGDG